MRFLTFSVGDKTSWGVATASGLIDLGTRC